MPLHVQVCSAACTHIRTLMCKCTYVCSEHSSPVTVHATALTGSLAVAISRKVSPSSNLSSRAQQELYRMRLGTWEESRLSACLRHCSPCWGGREGEGGRGGERGRRGGGEGGEDRAGTKPSLAWQTGPWHGWARRQSLFYSDICTSNNHPMQCMLVEAPKEGQGRVFAGM